MFANARSALTTTPSQYFIYQTGFNAPDDAVINGVCDASCVASISPWNYVGWQPTVAQTGAQYAVPPSWPPFSDGPRGHAARFRGTGFGDFIDLSSSGEHFETMANVITNSSGNPAHDVRPQGFSFRAWVLPEALDSQQHHVLVYNQFYTVWLRVDPTQFTNLYTARVLVEVRDELGVKQGYLSGTVSSPGATGSASAPSSASASPMAAGSIPTGA